MNIINVRVRLFQWTMFNYVDCASVHEIIIISTERIRLSEVGLQLCDSCRSVEAAVKA